MISYYIILSLYDENTNIDLLKEKINKLITSTLGENNLARYYDFYYENLAKTQNGKLDPKVYQNNDNEKYKKLVKKI